MVELVLNLFAPISCIGCQADGVLMCQSCKNDLLATMVSACYRCNKLTDDNKTCRSCRASSDIFSLDYVCFYENMAKKLLLLGKYSPARRAFRHMGKMFDEQLPLRDIDIVCSVPTASSRQRTRGFDHAALIAKKFATRRSIGYRPLLSRKTQLSQQGRGRSVRQKQTLHAFRLRVPPMVVRGKAILLVDDVISTGATLEAAAKLLKAAGARRVHAAVFARNVLTH